MINDRVSIRRKRVTQSRLIPVPKLGGIGDSVGHAGPGTPTSTASRSGSSIHAASRRRTHTVTAGALCFSISARWSGVRIAGFVVVLWVYMRVRCLQLPGNEEHMRALHAARHARTAGHPRWHPHWLGPRFSRDCNRDRTGTGSRESNAAAAEGWVRLRLWDA